MERRKKDRAIFLREGKKTHERLKEGDGQDRWTDGQETDGERES